MSDALLLQGDACHLALADQSVHCCVTSPPHLGLRSYHGLVLLALLTYRFAPHL